MTGSHSCPHDGIIILIYFWDENILLFEPFQILLYVLPHAVQHAVDCRFYRMNLDSAPKEKSQESSTKLLEMWKPGRFCARNVLVMEEFFLYGDMLS